MQADCILILMVETARRPTADALAEADDLRRAIGDFVRAVREAADSLPAAHIETLGWLARDGDQSISSLARKRGVRHQSMSAIIDELQAAGLVTRSSDPIDARTLRISIAQIGRVAVEEERRTRAGIIARAAQETLNEDQQRALTMMPELLQQLAAAIRAERS